MGVYVNLFIPSELNWEEKGFRLRQDTKFPEQTGDDAGGNGRANRRRWLCGCACPAGCKRRRW